MRYHLILLPLLIACIHTAHSHASSTDPEPRLKEYSWMSVSEWYRRHADDVEAALSQDARVVFAGDSITQGWENSSAYRTSFQAYHPVNLGIGGDKTENLLWRLQHNGTGNLTPKVVVLLIGVNNFGIAEDSPKEVFRGVEAVVTELEKRFSDAQILVLSILPWGQSADDPKREKVKAANQKISQLESERVTVLDIGSAFLEPDGSISPEIMADFLHPTEEGYERMTAAVLPTLRALLEK